MVIHTGREGRYKMQLHDEIKQKLAQYITDNYIDITCLPCAPAGRKEPAVKEQGIAVPAFLRRIKDRAEDKPVKRLSAPMPQAKPVNEIDDFLKESFEEGGVAKRLNLYMYERDITTAMIYERCFVDRKLISKITSGKNYHPSKNTMLALCIGLRLNLQEGEAFLLLAGYSFSNTSKYDLIMKFMLQNEIYDLDIINEMLYLYEQPCLGA